MLASVPPLDLREALTGWELDPLALVAVLGAGACYLRGVALLRARGRRWPASYTAAFAGGLVALLIATSSALARYEDVLFVAHALQHTLLAMVAPPLLALGAPITLALQAGRRSTQTRLLGVLHSRPARFVTHPVVVWLVFAATFVGFYFSPLFELSLRNDVAHAIVHVHFVVIGCLFFWLVVGADPLGRRIAEPVRGLLAFSLVPVHAIVGLALVTSTGLVAGGFYGTVARSWGPSPLADQRTAGGILWAAGDVIGVVVLLTVVLRWLRHEEIIGARIDRRLGDRGGERRATPPTAAAAPTEWGPR